MRVLKRGVPHARAPLGRAIPKAGSAAPLSTPAGVRACANVSETGALELRVSALRRPASGDGRGPRGGAGDCSGWRVPGSGRSPLPRTPPLQVAPAPPPPERPSARGPDTRSARRDPCRGAARASAPPVRSWGREGEPDGWAEAAPPPSAELVGAKLWKQKDSDYLSGAGAGAGSSAVRLPGAGRVFSSRKAGAARELSPPSCCPGTSAASVSCLARSGLG